MSPISRRSRPRSRACWRTDGLFAFTVETHDGDGVIARRRRCAMRMATRMCASRNRGSRPAAWPSRCRHPRATKRRAGGRDWSCVSPRHGRVCRPTSSRRVPLADADANPRACCRRSSRAGSRARGWTPRAHQLALLESARGRPLGAADRADRRRQDAGRLPADLVELMSAARSRASSSPPARTSAARQGCTRSTSRR